MKKEEWAKKEKEKREGPPLFLLMKQLDCAFDSKMDYCKDEKQKTKLEINVVPAPNIWYWNEIFGVSIKGKEIVLPRVICGWLFFESIVF